MNPLAVAAIVTLNNVSERDRDRAAYIIMGYSFAFAAIVGGIGALLAWLGA